MWWLTATALLIQATYAVTTTTVQTFHLIQISSTTENDNIPEVASCTIESLSRLHPNADIIVHSNQWSQENIGWMRASSNIHVKQIDFQREFLAASPKLHAWYIQNKWKDGYQYHHLSDALRLALLYNYGGVYVDLDVILVCPLSNIPANSVGVEGEPLQFNNAVLMFEKQQQFLTKLINEFVETFQPRVFGWNGPQLISRVWKQQINSNKVIKLNQSFFYTIPWFETEKMFQYVNDDPHHNIERTSLVSDPQQLWYMIRDPTSCCKSTEIGCVYGIHLWHSQIKDQLLYTASHHKHSFIDRTRLRFCPLTTLQSSSKSIDSSQVSDSHNLSVSLVIQHPVIGRQYPVGTPIPLRLQVHSPERHIREQLQSSGRICVSLKTIKSGPIGCFDLSAKEILLRNLPTGHLLLIVQICSPSIPSETSQFEQTFQGRCEPNMQPFGKSAVVAFNIDFQNSWKTNSY